MDTETKTEQQLKEDFIADYKALCDHHGFIFNVILVAKQSQDSGIWGLIPTIEVQRMPRK